MQVNRALLCPQFEGYKLKQLDAVSGVGIQSRIPLIQPVNIDKVPCTSSTPYRILEERGRFNHLFTQPNAKGVFYVDQHYSIWHVVFDDKGMPDLQCAHDMPAPIVSDPSLLAYPSVHSLSDSLYLLYDGASSLSIMEFNASTRRFTEYQQLPPLTDIQLSYSRLSACHFYASTSQLALLLCHSKQESVVDDLQQELKERIKTVYYMTWFTFHVITGEVSVMPSIKSASAPFYAIMNPQSTYFYLVSEYPFDVNQTDAIPEQDTMDAQVPTIQDTLTVPIHAPSDSVEYIWNQSDEDVTVHIQLPTLLSKHQVDVKFTQKAIQVRIKESVLFSFHDILHDSLVVSECMWTLEQQMLTLYLAKAQPERMWKWVFQPGDASREMQDQHHLSQWIQSATQQEPLNDPLLQPVTTDLEVEDLEGNKVVFTGFQVSKTSITRTHLQSAPNHEWMGTCLLNHTTPSSHSSQLCLKMDVDGLVYSMSSTDFHLKHVATVPALAYVRNSKKDRRFLFITSDMAIIVESNRYLYCYKYSDGPLVHSEQYILDLNLDPCTLGEQIYGVNAVCGVQYLPSTRQLIILKDSVIICVKI